MTWYEWTWAVVGVILFFAFFFLLLMGSLMNFTVGDIKGGFISLLISIPFSFVVAITWPAWFPFTFILDVRNGLRKNK